MGLADSHAIKGGGHRRLYLAILLVTIAVASAQIAAHYDFGTLFSTHNDGSRTGNGNSGNVSSTNSNSIKVSTLFNYGNGTARWVNNSRIPMGWNFYDLTVHLTNGNVESTYYPSYREHFVSGINGIRENGSFYWHLWAFCNKDDAWALTIVGADDIVLSNNQVLSWYYASSDSPPIPAMKTVALCS